MNFLAHLHLAHLADSSLAGNLLADFVRGNPEEHYAPEVVSGIHMHRRVAPITLDVMWDHFLSRHWQTLSPDQPLADFVGYARRQVAPILPASPAGFQELNDHLWPERWLERYREMDFIRRVLGGMANRRPRLGALRDSWQDLDSHYPALEELFWQFYPQMMARAQAQEL
ncbi:ACP phosphodiesterase [Pluralibacter gergoviae]|uniref:ACP phosphodiesterase n=1 Tax=Pluralibacter gergoviae TaxID=61647 RepID=UPI003EE1881E